MEITKGIDNAHYSIIIDKEKYKDIFIDYGKICSIVIVLKENNNSKFKIKIGETELSNDDFNITESYSWDLSQTTIKGNCSKHNSEIEFKKDDVFYIEQSNFNIWKVVIWIDEINGKNLKQECDFNLKKCIELSNSIMPKPKNEFNMIEKFEMKSRESRGIFDSNIYPIGKIGLRLGFRTEINLSETLICSVKDYDFFGQSCEIFIDLKDYHISGEEFIFYIKEIEENYKPENLISVEQIKEFYKKSGFNGLTRL